MMPADSRRCGPRSFRTKRFTAQTASKTVVLPNRYGIPAKTEPQLDLLAIGFARAGRRLGTLGGPEFCEKAV